MKKLNSYILEKLVIDKDVKVPKIGDKIYDFFLQFDGAKRFKNEIKKPILDFFDNISKTDSYVIYISDINHDKWTISNKKIGIYGNVVSANYISDLYDTYKIALDDDADAKERIKRWNDGDENKFTIATNSAEDAIYLYSYDKYFGKQELIFKKISE